MSASAEMAAQQEDLPVEPQNDNRRPEICPRVLAGVTPDRLERAARVLARRLVDLALREIDPTMDRES